MSTRRSKYWCFTINNPTDSDTPPLDDVTYIIYSYEEGSKEETPHWQGYVEYSSPRSLARMKKLMPRAHCEARRGTSLQASDYCKKDGALILEQGTISPPPNTKQNEARKRNWSLAMSLAKEGRFDEMDESILFPHYHAAKRIRQDYQLPPPDLEEVTGFWFVGPPNTGKSYTARKLYPGLYDKPCNKWWDGYQGQETVLVDDFDLNHKVLGHHLKRWADCYSFPAEHKGTTIQIRPKRIIVTSNYTISELFCEDPQLCDAITRRFAVTEFSEVYRKK